MSIILPPFGLPWAMLDRDVRHTGHSNAVGPVDPSVLGKPWPYKTGGSIFSSPAIDYAGTAYVGSDDGFLHAVGFNGKGAPLYKTGYSIQASPALFEDTLPPMEGQALAPPVIYFGSDNGQIYSILPNGTLRWTLAPGAQPNQSPVRSSPVVAQLPSRERWVYVGADNGQIYAIFETTSPPSAQTAWEVNTASPLRTSPALSPKGNLLYVGASDGMLYCLDSITGKHLPNTPVMIGGGALTTPAVDLAGNVYVANVAGTLFAFDPAGGGIWKLTLGSRIASPPTLGLKGEVLIIADDILYAVSATGIILWKEAFPNHRFNAAAPITDSAGTVFVASVDGWVFGVSRHPTLAGSRLSWSVQVDPVGPTLTTPALDGHGRVYVGALDSHLYVIDEVPAFQIAFHSDLSALHNLDVHSLRETYGVLDPARTLRLTDDKALDQQPAYSLDRSVMAYVSDRGGSKEDVYLANAIATDEENLTGPGSPFPPTSAETGPAFTPINDLTGFSRPPHLKSYLALTSNVSGLNRLNFTDLEAQAAGSIKSQSFTDWAMSLGVPSTITPQLEPPNTEQTQIAFAPDGNKMAWRHCEPITRIGNVKLLRLQGSAWYLTDIGPHYQFDPESSPQRCGDEPSFAPDSGWLVVREGPSLAVYDIVGLQAPVFSTPKSPVGNPTHPNWSPDGSEIAVGLNTGKLVDLFVASGKSYSTFSRLTKSRISDEPYYHYFKMPPPQALRLSPDQQFPGATIEILGRGFDILHPKNNKVFFTDTQRGPLQEAEVLKATVNPYEGLGVLTVKVPDFAGHGPITVETRFGSSTTPEFHVLPKPARIVQPRSVPGAKVRVFGLGFDLHTAKQHTVSFTTAAGGFVTGPAEPGGLDGAEEFLIVQVPPGIAETGPIRVDNAFGGSICPSPFSQLHPTFTIARPVNAGISTGLPAYALQGSAGVPVTLTGTSFPFDPFFSYGGPSPLSVANVVVPAAPLVPSVGIGTFSFSAAGPDIASFGPSTVLFPSLGLAHPGGVLSIMASDANLPAASAVAPFQVPLTNIPIIFVPGTSASSLDIAAGTPLPDPFISALEIFKPWPWPEHLQSAHRFDWLSKSSILGTPFGPIIHPPVLFPLNPGLVDPQHGPRVWAGPEGVAALLKGALVPPLGSNIGNHYLDAVACDTSGMPVRPEIVPGTVFSDAALFPGVNRDVYKPFIEFLTKPNMVGWPGRPLCNGINPTTPTTGTEPCFDVSSGSNVPALNGSNAVYLFNLDWRDNNRTQAARLNTFIDNILARADVLATKVVIIAHSYGGPVARSYYLNPANGAQSKVDQVISFGGGFSGVVVPLRVLEAGDTWNYGYGFGPLSVGVAAWETKALAQNWPTAYFQLPNSQSWFLDHGLTLLNGLGTPTLKPANRAYIRDFRTGALPFLPPAPGNIATYTASMNWIGRLPDTINGVPTGATRHNAFLAADQVAFFASPASTPIELGDFRSGTGAIYHHRIIGKGRMDTTVGSVVNLGPSLAVLNLPAFGIADPASIITEFVPTEHTFPVLGDGDSTVPYHGAIGRTLPSDDRVYILDGGQHDDLINKVPALSVGGTMGLLQLLLQGLACSQPQAPASYRSQNQIAEIIP